MPVADAVWSAWQELVDDGREPSVLMRFGPVADSELAVAAVRDAVAELLRPHLDLLAASDEHDPPRPGEWQWLGVPGAVLLLVADCDPFEGMMRSLAAALERRGLTGHFELEEWPQPPEARSGNVVSCHLRSRGRRVRVDPPELPVFGWQPDPEAMGALVAVAARWCAAPGGGVSYSVTKGTIGPVGFHAREDLAKPLVEALADGESGRLDAAGDGRWRTVGVQPYVGGIGLAAGGGATGAGDWHGAVRELGDLLRDQAELLAYAYVRRSRMPAVLGDPLERDWPPRPNARPRGGGFTAGAFEDVFAPDAFPVQLLGAGYDGRLPATTPAYRRELAGERALLLEHVDLGAWFEAPLGGGAPAPEALVDAREQLAPILYEPGALSRAGYVEIPDL